MYESDKTNAEYTRGQDDIAAQNKDPEAADCAAVFIREQSDEHKSSVAESGSVLTDADKSSDKPGNKSNIDASAKSKNSAQIQSAENAAKSAELSGFIAIGIKAAAIAAALIVLVTAIISVALPFSAMRVYNALGMSERALNSGMSYIEHRLSAENAAGEDEIGNFSDLGANAKLSGSSDFIEAIDVSSALAFRLMKESVAASDARSAEYFAQKSERYTRMYASLNGVRTVNAQKNQNNIEAMPLIAMRPYVYDYAHRVIVENFTARVHMGQTDTMLYDSGRDGVAAIATSWLSNTYAGSSVSSDTLNTVDGFVDYADCLRAYIELRLSALGITTVLTESEASQKYRNVLTGDEFSLFVTREDGFTQLYRNIMRFSEYAQAAVNFAPSDLDEMLHRLYVLNILTDVANKMWSMSMLLYYNADAYGANAQKVRDEYGICEMFCYVNYEGGARLMSEVYNRELARYIARFNA